jgi:hypothetical protein
MDTYDNLNTNIVDNMYGRTNFWRTKDNTIFWRTKDDKC